MRLTNFKNVCVAFVLVQMTILCAGVTAQAATGAETTDVSVRAAASDKRYWIAISEPTAAGAKTLRTRLQSRQVGGSAAWITGGELTGRVVEMSTYGDQLMVRTTDGGWSLVSSASIKPGSPLPDGAEIVAVCADENGFYAVGKTNWVKPAATTTSVATTAPATTPTTLPAKQFQFPPAVKVYRFEKGSWQTRAEITGNVPLFGTTIAIAPSPNGIRLAMTLGSSKVRISEIDQQGNQSAGQIVDAGRAVERLHWLGSLPQPTLAVQFTDGEISVLPLQANQPGKPISLSLKAPSAAPRTITAAGQMLRVVWVDSGKIREQAFSPTGVAQGDPLDLVQPSTTPPSSLGWPQLIMSAGLALVVLAVMRKKGETTSPLVEQGKLVLAPVGTRFAAGLIDFAPVFLLGMYFEKRVKNMILAGESVESQEMFLFSLAIFAVYVLYTFVCELLFAKTVGKMLFGLRVCDLAGNKPTLTQLVVRNLIRVFDAFPMVPMSMLIAFSPLRQRLGDMAAGTIVIVENPKPVEPPVEE